MTRNRNILTISALFIFSVRLQASTVYTFAPGQINPGNNLLSMGETGPVTVQSVASIGDGSVRFGGGLVFANGMLFAIGSDSNSNAALYSMGLDGSALTAVGALGNSIGWLGLAFDLADSNFYAIGDNGQGMGLYHVGAGGATFQRDVSVAPANPCVGSTLDPFSGLAYNPGDDSLYSIALDVCGVNPGGDRLFKETVAAGAPSFVMNLGGVSNTHMGGLGYAGSSSFFDIFTDVNSADGILESIRTNSLSTATLYDTQVQGTQNNGLAVVPEPGTTLLAGVSLLLLAFRVLGTRTKEPTLLGRGNRSGRE